MILRGFANGQPTPYDGQYLKDFDFEAHEGIGELTTTTDLQEARRFDSFVDAFDFYRRVPECRPLRADLQPNRPLTATNWEFTSEMAIRAEAR